MTVAQLEALEPVMLTKLLLECCGSTNWCALMLTRRPFGSPGQMKEAAAEIWWNLESKDWLEAFSKHPKIGENRNLSQWSSEEQSGMNEAAAQEAARIKELNESYFKKFGWIFIVCATGKSAAQMRGLLEQRMANNPAEEIRIAAAEQAKIMNLRLEKLLFE